MPLKSPQIRTTDKRQHAYATPQDLMNLKDENTVNKLLNQTKFNEITTRLASIETDIKDMRTEQAGIKTEIKDMRTEQQTSLKRIEDLKDKFEDM